MKSHLRRRKKIRDNRKIKSISFKGKNSEKIQRISDRKGGWTGRNRTL